MLLIRMKALEVILILLCEYVDEGSTDGRVLREDPQQEIAIFIDISHAGNN